MAQADPLLPPDKLEISSRAWSGQLVEHQTFYLWAAGSSPMPTSAQIASITASEVRNSIQINVTKPKNMFRMKSKFSFGKEKPGKSDNNFGTLKLKMVAKMDDESFKYFS